MKKIKIKELKIDKYKFKYPIFASSLSGYSDKSYRIMLKNEGVPLVFTEMISAEALVFNNIKTKKMIDILGEKSPIGVQILGKDPKIIKKAAKIAVEFGANIIDFNMGCPANKVIKNGEGAALINNPFLAIKILENLVNSVEVPVTLKIRKSFTEKGENSLKLIKLAEQVGIKAVFIHARSKDACYSGFSDWNFIEKVKLNVKIPVIGNGDITSPEQAKKIFKKSFCDGILIGRGFIGNPMFYKNCVDFFETGKYITLNFKDKIKLMLIHLNYMIEDKGENKAVKEIRKHAKYYLKGIYNNNIYLNKINCASKVLEIKNIFNF